MLSISEYETLSVLGSGQFGSVVLVRRNADRKLFAAKVPHGEDIATRQAARQEAQLLSQLNHANIVQFIELVEEDTQMALVMEYASGGDLDVFLRWQQESTGHLSEPAIMRIFIQIVLALQHLHEHRILHRDLKPKNILLDGDGIVKMSDFGVSKILPSTVSSAHTMIGTPHYMKGSIAIHLSCKLCSRLLGFRAPEMLDGGSYDCRSDIWSLGCILYELATFSRPFAGSALGAVVGQILNCDPPPVPPHYSSSFRVLVSKLLDKDPRSRPGLPEILGNHAVQHALIQLVSVATSHQPMLLEKFATIQKELNAIQRDTNPCNAAELVAPLPSHQHHKNMHERGGQVKEPYSQVQKEPKTNDPRQLFFENQAAARRNKERVDQEKSRAAVFLDCGATEEDTDQMLKPSLANTAQIASPCSRGISTNVDCCVVRNHDSTPSSVSARTRAQSPPSSSNYEELLNAERRRVQLETKALQERMRAMQSTE